VLIVTNTPRFPKSWRASNGEQGQSRFADSAAAFLRAQSDSDTVFLVDCDFPLTCRLAAALLIRRNPTPLVAVDLVLRRPKGLRSRALLLLRRMLLKRVDRHINYFRNVTPLCEVFRLDPARMGFVPFKVNLQSRFELPTNPEGDYVLCFGRSLRDYETFFRAVEQLPYPAAIANPNAPGFRDHGALFARSLSELPANLRLLEDDGSESAQIRILGGARLVVLPILSTTLVASGISTCLNAMAMQKCVLASSGPGTSDIFSEEILTFPSGDADALASLIRKAWDDDALRRRTALAGHRYAVAAGGEEDLYQRLIDDVVAWRSGGSRRL
jgi:glycosyltransferase involved in cell wall biosynthesis